MALRTGSREMTKAFLVDANRLGIAGMQEVSPSHSLNQQKTSRCLRFRWRKPANIVA